MDVKIRYGVCIAMEVDRDAVAVSMSRFSRQPEVFAQLKVMLAPAGTLKLDLDKARWS